MYKLNCSASTDFVKDLDGVNFHALDLNTAIRLGGTDRSDIHLHFA